jgi:hypothetical protein
MVAMETVGSGQTAEQMEDQGKLQLELIMQQDCMRHVLKVPGVGSVDCVETACHVPPVATATANTGVERIECQEFAITLHRQSC